MNDDGDLERRLFDFSSTLGGGGSPHSVTKMQDLDLSASGVGGLLDEDEEAIYDNDGDEITKLEQDLALYWRLQSDTNFEEWLNFGQVTTLEAVLHEKELLERAAAEEQMQRELAKLAEIEQQEDERNRDTWNDFRSLLSNALEIRKREMDRSINDPRNGSSNEEDDDEDDEDEDSNDDEDHEMDATMMLEQSVRFINSSEKVRRRRLKRLRERKERKEMQQRKSRAFNATVAEVLPKVENALVGLDKFCKPGRSLEELVYYAKRLERRLLLDDQVNTFDDAENTGAPIASSPSKEDDDRDGGDGGEGGGPKHVLRKRVRAARVKMREADGKQAIADVALTALAARPKIEMPSFVPKVPEAEEDLVAKLMREEEEEAAKNRFSFEDTANPSLDEIAEHLAGPVASASLLQEAHSFVTLCEELSVKLFEVDTTLLLSMHEMDSLEAMDEENARGRDRIMARCLMGQESIQELVELSLGVDSAIKAHEYFLQTKDKAFKALDDAVAPIEKTLTEIRLEKNFVERGPALDDVESDIMRSLRLAFDAMDRFAEHSFPIEKHELWQKAVLDMTSRRVQACCAMCTTLTLSRETYGCTNARMASRIRKLVTEEKLDATGVAFRIFKEPGINAGLKLMMNARFYLKELGSKHDDTWGFSYW